MYKKQYADVATEQVGDLESIIRFRKVFCAFYKQ